MANANYWVTKTVDPQSVLKGGTCTYTLTLNNSTHNPISAVYLYDSLPAGLTLIPGSVQVKGDMMDNETLDGQASVGGLNPEGTLVVTYRAYASQDVSAAQMLSTHACFYDGQGNNLACGNNGDLPSVPPGLFPVLPPNGGDGDGDGDGDDDGYDDGYDDDYDVDDATSGLRITIGTISIGTVNITCRCNSAASSNVGCDDGDCDEDDDGVGYAPLAHPQDIQPL